MVKFISINKESLSKQSKRDSLSLKLGELRSITSNLSNSKKSQIWSLDIIVGIIIFFIGIMLFYIYSINYSTETDETLEYLYYDGHVLMNSILSEGSPSNWNSGDVLRIGVLNDGQINATKLERFYNFSVSDYNRTKIVFDTKFDYYFFLDGGMGFDSGVVSGIGKPGFDTENIDAQNLIKLVRITIYNKKPTGAYLYIWEA